MAVKNMYYQNDKELIEVLLELLELHEQEILPPYIIVDALKKIVHRYHFDADSRGEEN
jgi:hypothetical protein